MRRKPPPVPPLPTERPAPVGVALCLPLAAPQAASHARFAKGRGGFHLKPYAEWREAAAARIQATWPYAPVPAHTPVSVRVLCLSKRPKDRPDWCPEADWATGGRLLRPVRPDIENFAEAVLDALMPGSVSAGGGKIRTRGVLADDASVVRLLVEDQLASVAERPCTGVWITVLGSLVPLP